MKIDLDQYILIPVFLILLIFATTEVRAQESSAQVVAQMEEVAPAKTKKISASVTLEHASNLSARNNPDRDESTSLILEPKYVISEKASVAGRVDFVQNYDSERKSAITNSVVVLAPTKIDLAKELQFIPEVSATLPTDQDMRDETTFRGGLALRPTLTYNVNSKLSLLERVYLAKNFHEYEITANYAPNVEYSIRNRFAASYAVGSKWSLDATFDFVKAFTYKGYSRETFYFAQSLNYLIKTDWIISVGHKNEGSASGPNNHGENVAFADSKSSYISLGLSHVF